MEYHAFSVFSILTRPLLFLLWQVKISDVRYIFIISCTHTGVFGLITQVEAHAGPEREHNQPIKWEHLHGYQTAEYWQKICFACRPFAILNRVSRSLSQCFNSRLLLLATSCYHWICSVVTNVHVQCLYLLMCDDDDDVWWCVMMMMIDLAALIRCRTSSWRWK